MESDAFSGIYFDDIDKANYADSSFHDKDDDTDEDDEESCDSTVINGLRPGLVRPPPTVSLEEQAQFYWNLCYGNSSKRQNLEKTSLQYQLKGAPQIDLHQRITHWFSTLEESRNLSLVATIVMITTSCKQAEESGRKKC